MKLDVFISYSSKNKDLADAIVQRLEGDGMACWYAPRNIAPGQEWVTAINEAIEAAPIFLFLYTEESNASRQVANEIALAFNAGKKLLPYRATEAPMNNEIKYYLTRVQWLDAVGLTREQGMDELCERVKAMLATDATNVFAGENFSQKHGGEAGTEAKTKKSGKYVIWGCLAAALLLLLLGGLLLWHGSHGEKEAKVLCAVGYELWQEGKKQEASEAFEKAAAQGYVYASLAMGTLRADDLTNEMKKSLSTSLLSERASELQSLGERLASEDCLEGNYLLGVCAAEGFGSLSDKEKALLYFEKTLQGQEDAWVLRSYGYLCMLHGSSQGDLVANPERVQHYAQEAEKLLSQRGWNTYEDSVNAGLEIGMAYANAAAKIADAFRTLSMDEMAFPWYQKAADAGVPYAMNQLGLAYLRGEGTEENAALAREWFEKAAQAGDVNAEKNLEYLK